MNIIEIEKELIPYSFDVELSGRVYTIEVNYNTIFDFFTLDISIEDKKLVSGEKMILNEPLFEFLYEDKEGNINPIFPSEYLVPVGNDDIKRITYKNLNEEVFLYCVERGEVHE